MRVDFQRLEWTNYPDTDTPIDADNLNRIEEGVAGLYADLSDTIGDVENLKTTVPQNTSEINTLKSRVDGIIALPDGSTTADAELVDIRTGAGGETYPSAGDSVRGQIGNLKNALNDTIDYLFDETTTGETIISSNLFTKLEGVSGAAGSTGITLSSSSSYDTYYRVLTKPCTIYFDDTQTKYLQICYGENYTGITSTKISCSNTVRKRSSDGNLPTFATPLTLNAGDVIAISCASNNTALIYGLTVSYSLSDEMKQNVIDATFETTELFIDKTTEVWGGATYEVINLYCLSDDGEHYILYQISKTYKPSDYADTWRTNAVYICDKNRNKLYTLTNVGAEIDCAIRLNNTSDFMGGSAHGDEIATNYYLFVDGVQKDITAHFSGKISDFDLVVYSNLYNPGTTEIPDHQTIVATHSKTLHVDARDKKYTVDNNVVWGGVYTVDNCYFGMMGLLRSDGSNTFCSLGYENVDMIVTDISTGTFSPDANSGGLRKIRVDSQDYIFLSNNENCHLKYIISVNEVNEKKNGRFTNVIPRVNDNKYYYNYAGDAVTANGETWQAKVSYKFIMK